MNQVEIVRAILAGEVLDSKRSYQEKWVGFNDAGGWIERTLEIYIRNYECGYQHDEFRIRPKTVRFQTRAYLVGTIIYVWTSSWSQTQEETASMYSKSDGGFRWLEETQETEYTI